MAEVVRPTPAPRPQSSPPVPTFRPWYMSFKVWIVILLLVVVPPSVASATGELSIVKARISYETGDVKPSDALIQTISLMGETILLALLATTIAIVFTVPISFLGAHNLMAGSILGEAVYWIT